MFQTNVVQKFKNSCSVTFFFRKLYRVRDNVRKYCEAGQATDDKMAHAQQCMLDT